MSISKDRVSVLIDENYLEKLESKEIDISVLEAQYEQLVKYIQKIQNLHDRFYDNLLLIMKER